jgi:hypothetical protein
MIHEKFLQLIIFRSEALLAHPDVPSAWLQRKQFNILFFDFPFSLQVWDLMLASLHPKFHPPSNWNEMFVHWKQRYAGSFNKKLLFASLWRQIPKFTCWGIWLARNKAIFQNKSLPPKGFRQACGLLSEVFLSRINFQTIRFCLQIQSKYG